jgi:hypothetical protein
MQLTALHRRPFGLRPADRTAIPSYRQTRQRRKPCPLHDRLSSRRGSIGPTLPLGVAGGNCGEWEDL